MGGGVLRGGKLSLRRLVALAPVAKDAKRKVLSVLAARRH